jgi:hypothetical protein
MLVRTVALGLLGACTGGSAGDELPADGGFTSGPEGGSSFTQTTNMTSASQSGSATSGPDTGSGSSDDSGTSDSTTTASSATMTSSNDTTASTTDPTSTGSEDSGPRPMCGDGTPADGEICFLAATDYAMGTQPSDVVIGDFDGDGALDVATANRGSDDVSVRLGAGDGTLGAEATFVAGDVPVALEVGRFDAGNDDDLAVVVQGASAVAILLADGNGGFGAATPIAAGTMPIDVTTGQLDNALDMDVDLVVLDAGADDYRVLVSDGDGTFTLHGPFTTDVATPATLVAGSYNSMTDMNTDVFVLGGDTYRGSPGNGAGDVDDATLVGQVLDGTNLVRAIAGAIDGDATVDILVADDVGDQIILLRSMGNAQFATATATAQMDPSDVAFGDVTNDESPDVVVCHAGADTVAVIPQEMGMFGAAQAFAVGTAPTGVKVGDLDEDGALDLVVSHTGGVSVLLSDP